MSPARDPIEDSTLSPKVEWPQGIASAYGRRVLGEFDYDVEFPPTSSESDRLRVIYAENGMGKTNFLRALHFLLNPGLENLQALAEIPIHRVGARLRSGWVLEMTHSDSEADFAMTFVLTPPTDSKIEGVQVAVGAEELDGRYARRAWSRTASFARFQSLLAQLQVSTVLVGDDRSVLSSLDTPRFDSDAPTAREAREAALRSRQRLSVRESLNKLESAFTRMTIAGVSNESAAPSTQGVYLDITSRVLAGTSSPPLAAVARADLISRAEIAVKRGSLFEKYGLLSLRELRGILGALTETRSNDTRLRQLHTVIDPYLTSITGEMERLSLALQVIDTFVQSVNSFLRRKSLVFTTLAGMSLVNSDKQSLDPDSLSSGEKHLLLLMSNATLARFSGSLVIIDEPELSLGLRWQRSLLSELLRCTQGSAVQFLIASHSVQILGDISDVISPSDSR